MALQPTQAHGFSNGGVNDKDSFSCIFNSSSFLPFFLFILMVKDAEILKMVSAS